MADNVLRKRSTRSDSNETIEKKILGVPARIMKPRLIFITLVALLVLAGFVMIYSSSSIEALNDSDVGNDGAYYLKRQMISAGLGLIAAAIAASIDYHYLAKGYIGIWVIIVGLLFLVWVAGQGGDDTATSGAVSAQGANGSTRWIAIGPITLQPSEFAKPAIVIIEAYLALKFFIEGKYGLGGFILRVVVFMGVPLALIFVQPDKGTTAIILFSIASVAYYAGFPEDLFKKIIFFAAVVFIVVSLADGYSRERILTMFDPLSASADEGYQLTQGFIAFGTGGIFGQGLGMSVRKYGFLFAAYNDLIFAIIGEEFGLIGTLLVLAAFAVLTYEAIQISRNAPDDLGRFIVIGATTIIISQFFTNVLGELSITPLTGKPIPFLSFGGSAIMASLILVGLILNVSFRSKLPDTEYDERRRSMAIADEDTGVGEAQPRSSLARSMSVVDGGFEASSHSSSYSGASTPLVSGSESSGTRASRGKSSGARVSNSRPSGSERSAAVRKRVDLGPSASERLRSDSGPRVRGEVGSATKSSRENHSRSGSSRSGLSRSGSSRSRKRSS